MKCLDKWSSRLTGHKSRDQNRKCKVLFGGSFFHLSCGPFFCRHEGILAILVTDRDGVPLVKG